MGLFNYKDYHQAQITDLISASYNIAVYANTGKVLGLGSFLVSRLFAKHPDRIDYSTDVLNEGWRDITVEELRLSSEYVDSRGFYRFPSPVTGNPASGFGPQLKVVGLFDAQQNLQKIAISFCGTNDICDIVDYTQLNNGKALSEAENLLQSIRDFAISNGLSGEDVIVTGYSLGGGLTNIMARLSESLADGFYANSDYIAWASPLVFDGDGKVLNIGFENDPVFRVLGDGAGFWEAVKAMGPGLTTPDREYDSSPDNIVLYTDLYGSFLWNIIPFSVLALPLGSWSAHFAGSKTDAFERILGAQFYDYMSPDSTVIVDEQSSWTSWYSWVHDKGDESRERPVFIIGNDGNNLLAGGKGGDYIEGGGGNDKIEPGKGANRVDGGSGYDTLLLSDVMDDWNIYRVSDGTLFFHSERGAGLTEATGIEGISFSGDWRSKLSPYQIEEEQITDHRYLLKWRNKNVDYGKHTEGTNGDDSLFGNIIFGLDGNDILHSAGGEGVSLLHGGRGNDYLHGASGNDELYGAEGNDWLYGGGGNDYLYGGTGHDVFVFDAACEGNSFIMDFNKHKGEKDFLFLSKDIVTSTDEFISCLKQTGNDVEAGIAGGRIYFVNTALEDINHNSVYIV
ncbi:hypothetical protein HIU27_RS24660 [Escherichia coli]|uniref:hypothetical protein n=1 Tax=Escherichia coli TaxID=562 RepID=UPI000D12A76C|nr:hypothetical protein [Escherichia coli]EFE9081826.1 hypothetical protein [Escherichia coli]EFE9096786.1 hypothetical protein [Escherichia coli]EFE9140548.1 hypothetical protein [Escherichia coli]EFE9145639.1 hypothetical protein [Escherichia coli]EFE9180819.1 hypothetical protein [Escherichia coli]